MDREDYSALQSLGFEDGELKELGLWEPAIGAPWQLADMYVRRSKKKDTMSSLREQVRRMCQQAERDKVVIRHVWFEQRSASKAYVRREEFEKACDAVAELGLSKTLYVFKTSRLSRRGMGQVGLLLDRMDEQAARIYVVSEGLDSRHSRMLLALLSEQAREQAKDIAEFTTLGIGANKAEGTFTGGVAPYGLRAVSGKLEHRPDEYPTARRIAVYLLDRKTPAWIADKLNSEGLPTRHHKKWQATGIIALAHSVTWAGLVANREKMLDDKGRDTGKYHRGGAPLLDKDGHPVSLGQGVISFAEHVKVNKILASRAHPGTTIGDRTRGKREIVSLLSASLRCGLCGGAMANGGVNYRCYNRQVEGPTSCLGMATDRARADHEVARMWIDHILALSPESDTLLDIAEEWLAYKDPEKEVRKTNVQAALESAVGREMKLEKEYFVLGKMDEERYDRLRVEVAAQIKAHKAELATLSTEADLSPLMDGGSLAALWNGAGPAGQRALLRAALTRKGIVLAPPRHRGDRTPLSERLTAHWKDAA